MPVFLSYRSSLKYWRSDAPYYAQELLVAPAFGVALDDCTTSVYALRDKTRLFADDSVFDILVGGRAARRHAAGLSVRMLSLPLPDGSFYQVERDVYACSPELTFALAAADLPLRSLVALGLELCGTYSLFGDSSAAVKRARITDAASIASYLDKIPGLVGAKAARRALRCIRDGSASPRETDLFMMLCLPTKAGGFGLPAAHLNRTMRVPAHAQSLTGLTAITPDLFWPDHGIALEYESTESHGAYASTRELYGINQRKLASDSERRRTYEAMHVKALTVTNGEFASYSDMRRIAGLIARLMGKHSLSSSVEVEFRRSQLHAWLKVPAQDRDDIC